MSGNLKRFRIATMVTVLMMAGGGAAVAQAAPAHFTASSLNANVKLKWEADPVLPEQLLLTTFGAVNCNLFAADGTMAKTSGQATASNVLYESTYFPSGNCEAFGLEAKVSFNGCDYTMNAGTFVGAGESVGTTDLVCPVGQSVKIVTATCTVTIPAQSGIGKVWYRDSGGTPKDITVEIEAEEIAYSGVGSTCSGSCTDGFYLGDMTLKAYEDTVNAPQVPLAITST